MPADMCERCGEQPATVTMASDGPHPPGTPPVHGPTHRYCHQCARTLGMPERPASHLRRLDELAKRESKVMAEATAICDALLASIPQPLVSAAQAMRDLSDAERVALLASREETLRVIRGETAEMQVRLDRLTAQAHTYQSEFKAMMGSADHRRMREIAEWFEANNDEVGVLKVAIEELSDFATRLDAL